MTTNKTTELLETPTNTQRNDGWMRRLAIRLRLWMCDVFGHAFSEIDELIFKIECEGRCYTVDALTGERHPMEKKPEIKCQRCGKYFTRKETEQSHTRRTYIPSIQTQ